MNIVVRTEHILNVRLCSANKNIDIPWQTNVTLNLTQNANGLN